MKFNYTFAPELKKKQIISIMKKVKVLALGTVLASSLVFSTPAQAGRNKGNYINAEGCLVVWKSYTALGITWSSSETVFCNSDGSAIKL